MDFSEYKSVVLRQHAGRIMTQVNKYQIIDPVNNKNIGSIKANMFIPFMRKGIHIFEPQNKKPIFELKDKSKLLQKEYVLSDQNSQIIGTLSAGQFRIKYTLKLTDQIAGAEYELDLKDPEGKVVDKNEQQIARITGTQERIARGPGDIDKYKIDIIANEMSSDSLLPLLLSATVLIDQVFKHENL